MLGFQTSKLIRWRFGLIVLLVAGCFVVGTKTSSAQWGVLTDEATGIKYRLEKYTVANFPVAMAFAPDGRLFYTEKNTGSVRMVNADGALQVQPVITFTVSALVERGTLGIALDPNYRYNGYLWVVYTAEGDLNTLPTNTLVRFREVDGIGRDPQVMLQIPIVTQETGHNGGNVHFDADGLLYLSVGDYQNAEFSQDMSVPMGKIHRFEITPDGLIPAPGNPIPDSSIFAYGFRNPFDFTFDPLGGHIFASENGPTCDDEINIVFPGHNYGWGADYTCIGTEPLDVPDYVAPLISFTPTQAPTGIEVYTGETFPEWYGQVLFCTFNNGFIRRMVLDEDRTGLLEVAQIELPQYRRCQTDVAVGPDGNIYMGEPDSIYRIVRYTE